MDWNALQQQVHYLRDIFKKYRIVLKSGEGLTLALDEAEACAKGTPANVEATAENMHWAIDMCGVVMSLYDSVKTLDDAGLDVSPQLGNMTTGTTDFGRPAFGNTRTFFYKDFEAELFIAAQLVKKGLPVQLPQKANDPRGEMLVWDFFVSVKHPNGRKQLKKNMSDFNGKMLADNRVGVFVASIEDAFDLADKPPFANDHEFEHWLHGKKQQIESYGRDLVLHGASKDGIVAMLQTATLHVSIAGASNLRRISNSIVFDERAYKSGTLAQAEQIAVVFNPDFRRYSTIKHHLTPTSPHPSALWGDRMSDSANLFWNSRTPLIVTRRSGVGTAFVILIICYAGFWLCAMARLTDTEFRARMAAAAMIISERNGPAKSDNTSQQVINQVNAYYQQVDPRFIGLAFHGTPEEQKELDDDIGELNAADPKVEAEYRLKLGQLDTPRPVGIARKDLAPREPGFWERFGRDYFRFDHVAFRSSQKSVATLPDEASSFLVYDGCTKKKPAPYGFEQWSFPWRLFQFYDPKEVVLSEETPLALAIILLACGIMLRYRYYDYTIEGIWTPRRTLRDGHDWINLWATEPQEKLSQARLQSAIVWSAALGAALLEATLDDPELRIEWLIKCPMMLLTGLLVAMLWITVLRLSRMTFNPRLAEFQKSFFTPQINALKFCCGTFLVACLWMIYFSLTQLFGVNYKMDSRGAIQIFIAVVSIVLVIRLLLHAYSNTKKLDQRRKENEKQAKMAGVTDLPDGNGYNKLEESSFTEYLAGPDVHAKIASGLALLLLPVFSVVKELLS